MHGEYKAPGGKLVVVVDLEVYTGRLAQVRVSGDFFLEPEEALDRINAALEGLPVTSDETEIAQAVRQAAAHAEMIGFSPEAVAVAVKRALSG
ncbi:MULTISPECIES: biotin--protein ligase [unclassified Meiothermus]|uniref:biotin--protein ligase n=1 Tax=unclassified Meiothermus TaxID=370471 RepID=UPI000D7C4C7F|nr:MULTISPECIES: biotin--protein ligase [unclassified Meiothermus]PZA08694.1 biotin--protein ligase [Meiothermus sp. Pnk-1]RYM40687.1 biotin--protein ligase [Meiothermus sp. PNK-Is4]